MNAQHYSNLAPKRIRRAQRKILSLQARVTQIKVKEDESETSKEAGIAGLGSHIHALEQRIAQLSCQR